MYRFPVISDQILILLIRIANQSLTILKLFLHDLSLLVIYIIVKTSLFTSDDINLKCAHPVCRYTLLYGGGSASPNWRVRLI